MKKRAGPVFLLTIIHRIFYNSYTQPKDSECFLILRHLPAVTFLIHTS